MRWRDFRSAGDEGTWQGLDCQVEHADRAAPAPAFRVCAGERRVRVECSGEPVLWAHVHDQRSGVWRLVSRRRATWAVVPPIATRDVRAIDAAPHTEGWWRAWARWFARELAASPRTPLHAGRWALTPAKASDLRSAPLPAPEPLPWLGQPWLRGGWHHVYDVRTCLESPALAWESWGINGSGALVRTRAPTPPEGARPRAYAKQARDGTLAPLLVQYVSGLDLYLLLDGHDRLRAAQLEDAPLALVVLWRVRRDKPWSATPDERHEYAQQQIARWRLPGDGPGAPRDVDAQNRLLAGAYADEHLITKSTAWPLRGGVEPWEREVIAEGVTPGHAMLRGAAG